MNGTNERDPNHVWQKGDVCTCEYKGIAGGLLYVVVDVVTRGVHTGTGPGSFTCELKIKPIYGLFQEVKGRQTRTIGSGWCKHYDLVQLGCEYAKFGHFIAELARLRSE